MDAIINIDGRTMERDGRRQVAQSASSLDASNSSNSFAEVEALVIRLLESGSKEIYREAGAAIDRVVLNTVLRHVKGHQVEAAERLGLSRTTLRSKLRRLGIVVEKHLLLEEADPRE
jgi:DNA-binding protein Fis